MNNFACDHTVKNAINSGKILNILAFAAKDKQLKPDFQEYFVNAKQ